MTSTGIRTGMPRTTTTPPIRTKRSSAKKGTITMTAKNNVTPADVAAKAAEEKLVTVVPAQPTTSENTPATEGPELTVIEGEKGIKKSLKERLAELTEKVKANKKAVVAVGAVIVTGTVLFVKYAKEQAEKALDETIVTEVEKQDIADDLAAHEIGG